MGNFGNSFAPPPSSGGQSYVPSEEYNPEEEPETWENEGVWETPSVDLETPESPPIFEKEGYSEPVEYHDNQTMGTGIDIDHRILSLIGPSSNSGISKKMLLLYAKFSNLCFYFFFIIANFRVKDCI